MGLVLFLNKKKMCFLGKFPTCLDSGVCGAASVGGAPLLWAGRGQWGGPHTTTICAGHDGGDLVASWALQVHEVGVGALHQG